MCIICLEYQRSKDLADARRMLAAARREPTSIDAAHLDEVESRLAAEGASQRGDKGKGSP
jgi:hypothetical protein